MSWLKKGLFDISWTVNIQEFNLDYSWIQRRHKEWDRLLSVQRVLYLEPWELRVSGQGTEKMELKLAVEKAWMINM